ncbi:hypothetical protein [Ectopseudomonas khazarica]|uniref:hypothetical protein n=1 Tax=Ectopseudomonas khazarica TaxID=2502979 RepID=UPI0037CB6CB2
MGRHILWLDCIAAALAGLLVLLFATWLSAWYALPPALLHSIGVVNIAYACFSFSLAIRTRRREGLIKLLALANGAWAALCLGITAALAQSMALPGVVHLLGEAVFVGGLGLLEWRWRRQLLVADGPRPSTSSSTGQ